MATGEYAKIALCRGNDKEGSMASNAPEGVNTGKYYDQKINWTTTMDADNLRTKVEVAYYVRCNNSIAGTQCVFNPKIQGSARPSKNIAVTYPGYTNNWKSFATHEFYVAHDPATGLASVTITASFSQTELASYGYALRDGNISKTITLPAIPVVKSPYMKQGTWTNNGTVYVKSAGTWVSAKAQAKSAGVWKDPVT